MDDKEITYDDIEKEEQTAAEKPKRKRTPSVKDVLRTRPRKEGPGGAGDMDGAGEDGAGDENPAGAPYITLQQWQERAMGGDAADALEPRVNLADGAALSPRIRALLDKRQQQIGKEEVDEAPGGAGWVAPEGKTPVRCVNYEHGSERPSFRTEMIVKVRAGLMTATAAAEAPRGVQEGVLQVGETRAAGDAGGGARSRDTGSQVDAGGRRGAGPEAQGEDPDRESGTPGGDGRPAAHVAAPGAPGR